MLGPGFESSTRLGSRACSYSFRVKATDAAGNFDIKTRSFSVDTVLPSLTIDSGPAASTTDKRPSFGFTAEGGSTVERSLDQGTASFGPCSSASSTGRPRTSRTAITPSA